MTRPPVGSTGTLDDLQVEAGDVVKRITINDDGRSGIGDIFTIDARGYAVSANINAFTPQGDANYGRTYSLIFRAKPDQPPLQIESGKYYRTRDGRKVGPMRHDQGAKGSMSEWRAPDNPGSTNIAGWFSSGRMLSHRAHADDLIAEWHDDQPAHIITHEGRQYDLTALETPFGLLPEPVQKALDAWPHRVEMMTYRGQMIEYNFPDMKGKRGAVWRAIPAPTEIRIQCYRGGRGVNYEHGTCIKNPGGSIDWASWRDAE